MSMTGADAETTIAQDGWLAFQPAREALSCVIGILLALRGAAITPRPPPPRGEGEPEREPPVRAA